MAEFAKQQGSVTQPRRPERAHLGGLSGRGFEPSNPGSVVSSGSAALDQEVLRDLRHAVGNHFHKLFYWADRLESETENAGQVEELTGALQRFQEASTDFQTGLQEHYNKAGLSSRFRMSCSCRSSRSS